MGARVYTAEKTMTASEIIAKKKKRVYAQVNGRTEMVWGIKIEVDHIDIWVWGDDINNLDKHSLPLDAKLTVL